jgi:L-amino acid N-acyltransferase YncA
MPKEARPTQPGVRAATEDDAAGVQAIYGAVVTNSAISFEYESPTVEEMARRIRRTTDLLPWLVAQSDDEIAGYAYAAPHRERAA